MKNAPKPLPEFRESDKRRFWDKVDKANDCWIWTASKTTEGYGQFRLRKRTIRAHRISFFLSGGVTTNDDPFVLHGPCNNPACVNPDHLSAGNDQVNLGRDKLRDGTTSRWDKNPSRVYPERVPRGINHHAAKLTEDNAREIRRQYAQGGITQRELAIEFSVPQPAISRVIHRKRWKHVA